MTERHCPLYDGTPLPLVLCKRALPRVGHVVFFTGDSLVSEDGVWREMATRFVLFEPLVPYNSCMLRERRFSAGGNRSGNNGGTVNGALEGVGVDSGSMVVTMKRGREYEL